VAAEKARAGLASLPQDAPRWVLGSDTEVVLGERVFGKPADAADALEMLRSLSGTTHEVVTAVVLAWPGGEDRELVISQVTFATLDEATIAAYVDTGEPFGKAGGYAIQGGAERHITHLAGSYSGVMGLPLYQTGRLLARAGLVPLVASAMEAAVDV